MPQQYPFSAVVGSDDMALALILTTISPEIGGVLVRGEKGTAKSTIVRALAAVLPPIDVVAGDRFSSDPRDPSRCPRTVRSPRTRPIETRAVRLVELPVGATEDRVLGSLHLERALSEGKAEYEPGLLARAHRGILYVDEVNLLHDHLVDLLLDAAAMGRSTVERDGVSVEHAARFVLVGTMNPEEGELRPQLLDRFGLTVEVAAPRDPALRVEVVRRRMAYDADPDGFAAPYAEHERALTDRIQAAQKLGRRGRAVRRGAAARSPSSARPSRSTACAPTSSPPAPPSPTPPGTAAPTVTTRGHPRRRPARAAAPPPPQPVRRPRPRRGPARPGARRRRARAGPPEPPSRRSPTTAPSDPRTDHRTTSRRRATTARESGTGAAPGPSRVRTRPSRRPRPVQAPRR